MNFLFGMALVFSSALILPILWWVIPSIRKTVPFKYVAIVMTFIIGLGFFSNMQTYGPRNELTQSGVTYQPERGKVEKSTKFIEPSERVGQFDDRLEDERPE